MTTTKPLAQRMREAADTLEEVSKRYDAMIAMAYPWTASQLRAEAAHAEAEEEQ